MAISQTYDGAYDNMETRSQETGANNTGVIESSEVAREIYFGISDYVAD